jgi:predicted ester cyclase/quinol monooxygenase YgiN
MFARNVSLRLKPGKLNEFTRTFDKEVLSILRKQPGFREEITFAMPGDVELIAISLWESKEQADAYNASAYPKVLQALHAMLDGAPKVQNLNVISSTIQHAGSGSGKAASASSARAARGGEMPSTTENKEIARRFIEECWNNGDTAAMRDLIADKCRYHDPAFPGVENIEQHITACRSAFKGPFLGMPPTNRACTVSGTSISRMEGGKITEQWADWNVMTLMEQLGVAAAPSAEEKVSARK